MAIKPMLCKLSTEQDLKNDPDWIFEPKYDGARIIAVVNPGQVRLFGRSGREKTQLFTELDLQIAKDTAVVLDGEVLSGTSFNDIQHRINRTNGVSQAMADFPARFVAFDILEVNGASVRNFPLIQRKQLLSSLLVQTANVAVSQYVQDGKALFDLMKANNLEGVVGKNVQSAYRENDRNNWIKVKCWQEATFMVTGYTQGTGWRTSTFGAMVLADLKGSYVGSVGTGFDNDMIASLVKMFSPAPCPWNREPEPAKWIKPFAVKIKFLEYTNDGQLRFPVFKGVV
jgi:bifunctional non-homologous end joining protein LigD